MTFPAHDPNFPDVDPATGDERETTEGPAREPILFASEYIVTALPLDHIDADSFWITVAWRGRRRPPFSLPGTGEWAVILRSFCLNDRDEWELEPQPSSRTAEWCASHRFTLDEAVKAAERMLHTVTVNGRFVDVDGQLSIRPQ